ncbi:diacylglycerol/lipid kinase family protein [Calditrichota bacterium]
MKIAFIINPYSGTPIFVDRVHHLIRRHLGSVHDINIFESNKPADAHKFSKQAAEEGMDIVVAVGGDGTVNNTAQALLNTDTALGVIPAGSGNGFAKNLNLPTRSDHAVKQFLDPKIRMIDVGQIGDSIFLVSCGLGWEAVIATLFEGSKMRGPVPYATAAIATFTQYEPQKIEVTTDTGWSYTGRPMFFTIANMGEYGFGANIAPDARPDDGLLDICILPRHSPLDAMKYAPELFLKNIDSVPGYIGKLAQEVKVKRTFEANIHLDGTPVLAGTEVTVRILKHALKIAVKPKSRHTN